MVEWRKKSSHKKKTLKTIEKKLRNGKSNDFRSKFLSPQFLFVFARHNFFFIFFSFSIDTISYIRCSCDFIFDVHECVQWSRTQCFWMFLSAYESTSVCTKIDDDDEDDTDITIEIVLLVLARALPHSHPLSHSAFLFAGLRRYMRVYILYALSM